MRVTGLLFGVLTVFFGLVAAVYWVLAHEPAGAAALVFTAGLAFLASYYFLFTARRVEPLPEDDEEGNIEDGAGQYGFFSPYSWWPMVVAGTAAVIGLGLVFFVWWLIALGVVATILGTVGWLFEYYRGDFVRN